MAYAKEEERNDTDMAEKSKTLSQDEQDDLLEQFKADLGEARAYMEPIQQRMDRDYETYRNYRRTTIDPTLFKVSDFFEYVETVVPIVTNNRIRASVHSDYPEYVTHAKGINDILDHTYDTNNWDYMSQEILRMALIYRSSFVYTGFDNKYKNGTGKLCIESCNARWCYIDPSVTQIEDSRFFFYVQPMRKSQMNKMYPDKKDGIAQTLTRYNTTPSNSQGTGPTNGTGNSWFRTWLGTVKNFLAFNGNNQAKISTAPFVNQQEMTEEQRTKNVIAYIHYWYRDEDDNWRVSYWADDYLLKDEANPFWHGCLPYDILSPVKDPLSVLGVPMNEQIESMSENRNAMMNYVLENSRLHANPPLLFNTSFGNVRDPQSLKEQATEGVIPVANPDMLPLTAVADYMSVPVIPGYATSVFDQLGAIKDASTGVNDSFRGTQQASSGKEVQLQQEAAYTRIKTMIDQFELTNKKVAEKVIVNAMQFYNQNRGFRIRGDYRKYEQDKQMNDQMPFEVTPIQKGINPQTQEPVYDRTEFFLYANPNEWTKLDTEGVTEDEDGEEREGEPQNDSEESAETSTTTAYGVGSNANQRQQRGQDADEQTTAEEVNKAFKVLQFTVEIEAGSSLPQSRLARREEANELYTAGAIDQESLLDTYDWPDREEIIKRMSEKAAQAADAQGQAAQAEAQGKLQAEQLRAQTQIQLKQMDLQQTQMQSQAKIDQQLVQNRGGVAEQGLENSGDSLAETLEQIRQQNPEATQELSDEEIIQSLQGAGAGV